MQTTTTTSLYRRAEPKLNATGPGPHAAVVGDSRMSSCSGGHDQRSPTSSARCRSDGDARHLWVQISAAVLGARQRAVSISADAAVHTFTDAAIINDEAMAADLVAQA